MSTIHQAIHQAIELEQKIANLSQLLESQKVLLRQAAEADLRDAGIKDLPGNSYTFTTPEGPIARVTWPAAGLVRQIVFVKDEAYKLEDKKLVKLGVDLRGLCGLAFNKLFATYYKPAKAFRELLGALLTQPNAGKVLKALTDAPSGPRVSFEVKEVIP